MRSERIDYQADVPLSGTLFLPEGPRPVPAVLVFPDIFGYGDHVLERAERVAGLGYAALAADLHGERQALAPEPAMAELARFYAEPDRPCARGDAALKALAEHPAVKGDRIAAIGFCYGGRLALEMARRGAPLAAVAGFHSSLVSSYPQGGGLIRGKILACIGSEDPGVPAHERSAFEAEMREAGVDWQLHLYGGVYHTFTNWRADTWGHPDFARYDAGADRRSWRAMNALLADVLGDDHS
ncbi:dienelactone hydrolase family protein [Novosphingobium sp.]|uniref:dienelactone hydrolase family protein n=1 Tax=Novosphingobium sp. TaxID=1874826 RepID=UPI002B4A0706|nr:dienelactone hydrolase family protein [Novosphingobium sp.]HKR93121.1 dienelactone hydrolase family protein [Novosphingobium sp.]